MFKEIGEAFKQLWNNLFGPRTPKTETKKSDLAPIVIRPEDPQDGSEVRPETIVIIADEMDHVNIDPNVPDEEWDPEAEFDEDIFKDDKPAEEPPTPSSRYLWCLDNGHGKNSKGKRSPVFRDGQTQFFEYEFNRDIVRRIADMLKEKGIAHYIVVPEVDVDDYLRERVNRANWKRTKLPKIYLSIHSNAAPARSSQHWAAPNISGIETWFYHGSKRGQKVASVFQRHLIQEMPWKNRHLKSRPRNQFFVLKRTKMTAVLTESGFYNNEQQAQELIRPEIRQRLAEAHVRAIEEVEQNGI